MLYTLRFFSSKCSLFHNANFFGSCIIHILYTACAKIKKNNSGAIGLNLNSTNQPRPWSPRESSPSRKIPTVELGIETGTSWLVVRDSDHEAGRVRELLTFNQEGLLIINYCLR